MDRATILKRLAQAERYCEQGADHVDGQARLVATLERAGREPTESAETPSRVSGVVREADCRARAPREAPR